MTDGELQELTIKLREHTKLLGRLAFARKVADAARREYEGATELRELQEEMKQLDPLWGWSLCADRRAYIREEVDERKARMLREKAKAMEKMVEDAFGPRVDDAQRRSTEQLRLQKEKVERRLTEVQASYGISFPVELETRAKAAAECLPNLESQTAVLLRELGADLSLLGDADALAAADEAARARAAGFSYRVVTPKPMLGMQLGRPAEQRQQEEEPQAVPESMECVVCRDRARDTVMVPCGHFVTCMGCARECEQRSGKCPICHARIGELVRSFGLDVPAPPPPPPPPPPPGPAQPRPARAKRARRR